MSILPYKVGTSLSTGHHKRVVLGYSNTKLAEKVMNIREHLRRLEPTPRKSGEFYMYYYCLTTNRVDWIRCLDIIDLQIFYRVVPSIYNDLITEILLEEAYGK